MYAYARTRRMDAAGKKENRREAGFEEWRARPKDMPEGRIDGPTDAKSQLEELALARVARPERFELPTPKFVAWCSIQLSYGRMQTIMQ